MGYQSGTIGPILYTQSNSGDNNDEDNTITYTAEEFGAPPGAQIITPLVHQDKWVRQGLAYVHNYSATGSTIQFNVYTQAAGGFPIGHHSGVIDVTTSFMWYVITPNAIPGVSGSFIDAELPDDLLKTLSQEISRPDKDGFKVTPV